MANNMNDAARRPHSPRRNRRKPGVPVLLAIVLVIMALLMGALGGFVVARKTDPHVHELQAAKDRVTELENTLTLIGYPLEDDVDPQQWLYDNTADDTALEDLTGAGWDEDADELWTEDSLLTGTLPEDGDPVVVAEFEGGELLSTEVIPAYNDQLTTLIFAGPRSTGRPPRTMRPSFPTTSPSCPTASRAGRAPRSSWRRRAA